MTIQYNDPQLQAWIDAVRSGGVKNSMNKFVSDGVKTTYDVNFAGGYLFKADIRAYKVSPLGLRSNLEVVAVNDNKVTLAPPAVTAGWTVVIFRDTPKAFPLVDFADNSIINEVNLDTNFKQTMFGVAEMLDRFDDTITVVQEAYAAADAAAASATAAATSQSAAAQSATAAASSASAAAASATAAAGSLSSATAAANTATTAATQASASAAAAAASASAAAQSETSASASAATATTKATSATSSATSAATSATNATNSATAAANSAASVSGQATAAAASATAAASSATNAANSATAASGSATAAATSASTAATKANDAATAAGNAAASATASSASATNAANSATAANTSATNAANSATAAAGSATGAAASATTATQKATAAAASAATAQQYGETALTTANTALSTANGIAATADAANTAAQSALAAASAGLPGMRNKLINGRMMIDQRRSGFVQTFTAGAEYAYCIDRFYAFCSGADVTGRRETYSPGNTTWVYKFTGSAGNTGVGIGQRIESLLTTELDRQTLQASTSGIANPTPLSLSVRMGASVPLTVTWALYHATFVNGFGTRASPQRSLVATGTFDLSSPEASRTASISVPSGSAYRGLELVLSIPALGGGETFSIFWMQLEVGSTPTALEWRSPTAELDLCKRYYQTYSNRLSLAGTPATRAINRYLLPVEMRASPTIVQSTATGAGGTWAATPITLFQSTSHSADAITETLELSAEL